MRELRANATNYDALREARATGVAPPPWLWRVINFTLWRERVVEAR